MSGIQTIGTVTSKPYGVITEDFPRWAALLITVSGSVIAIDEIESFETSKNDQGDAGTFTFTASLVENIAAASVIGPMDLIALYADRVSTDVIGGVPSLPISLIPPQPSADLAKAYGVGLTYGTTNVGGMSKALATPSCIMIGMVDSAEESEDFEGAVATFTVSGRDLTKIPIDNDTFVPATLTAGGQNGGIASVSNIGLRGETSGSQLIEAILDIFVAKDPNRVTELLSQPANQNFVKTVNVPQFLADLAGYGYPWRNFLSTELLKPDFKSFANGAYPPLAVQMGSAWANMNDIRNFPVCRLFINEIGQLIFDDAWSAWGCGNAAVDPAYQLKTSHVRSKRFHQADDDLVTVISIIPALLAAAGGPPQSITSNLGNPLEAPTSAIKRFGYRFTSFTSEYDPPTAFYDANVAQQRSLPLFKLHNDLWIATFVVKGLAKYRVGQRFTTNLGGVHPYITPKPGGLKAWYITEVRHSGRWGSDWTTTLTARFSADYPPIVSPAANVVGGASAPLG